MLQFLSSTLLNITCCAHHSSLRQMHFKSKISLEHWNLQLRIFYQMSIAICWVIWVSLIRYIILSPRKLFQIEKKKEDLSQILDDMQFPKVQFKPLSIIQLKFCFLLPRFQLGFNLLTIRKIASSLTLILPFEDNFR